jgi:hypothetical protein
MDNLLLALIILMEIQHYIFKKRVAEVAKLQEELNDQVYETIGSLSDSIIANKGYCDALADIVKKMDKK